MSENNSMEIVNMKKNDGKWLSDFFNRQKFMDGWSNVMTGLGLKNKDARASSKVTWLRLSEVDIENLYAGDSQAEKIVDLPIEEAFSKGYELTGVTPDDQKRMLARAKELCVDDRVDEAAKAGRMYGGAAILKVYANENLRLEQELPSVEMRQPIKNLLVLHRFELWADFIDIETNMFSPNFNNPVFYTFFGKASVVTNNMNVKIHHTRLIKFEGAKLPEQLRATNGYWGDSVLSKPYDSIRNYSFAHDSINAALKDLSVAVFKMNGLADNIAANGDANILKRLEMVNLSKSIARAVVLDAEGEDFDYKVRNLTGAADLVDRAENRLATEAKIPHTVLFGTSPKGGLGSEGTHDSENWYNFLGTIQDKHLRPALLDIYTEIAHELGINAEELDVEFKSLWSLSDSEKATTHQAQATADRIYIEDGVVTAQEVRNSRFKSGKFSVETEIDDTLDVAQKNAEVDEQVKELIEAEKLKLNNNQNANKGNEQ